MSASSCSQLVRSSKERPADSATSARTGVVVTGCIRSGTTWLGRRIARLAELYYYHEPFKLTHIDCPVDLWFPRLSAGQKNRAVRQYFSERKALGLKVRLANAINIARVNITHPTSLPVLLRRVSSALHKSDRSTPLFKSPNGVWAVDFFAKTMSYRVLALIRHPCAVARSIVAKGWKHDWDHFLTQESAIAELVPEYQGLMRKARSGVLTPVQEAALLWAVTNQGLLRIATGCRRVSVVQYEKLAANPTVELPRLASWVVTEDVKSKRGNMQREVMRYQERSWVRDRLSRRSESQIKKWKDELGPSEVADIRDIVAVSAEQYWDNYDFTV